MYGAVIRPASRIWRQQHGNLIDIQVPDIGDFDQVTVIELLVKPGDSVKRGTIPADGGVRQGIHGNPFESRRCRQASCKVALGDKVKRRARWCCCSKAADA
jgi:hypothetical protein